MTAPTAEEVILAEPPLPAKKRRCKKFLILLLVYAIFLLLGAAMFMHLEFSEQEEISVSDFPEWLEIKGSLGSQSRQDLNLTEAQTEWLQLRCPHLESSTLLSLFQQRDAASSISEVERQCGDLVQNVTVSQVNVYSWSFIEALYFSMTVITTIGKYQHYLQLQWHFSMTVITTIGKYQHYLQLQWHFSMTVITTIGKYQYYLQLQWHFSMTVITTIGKYQHYLQSQWHFSMTVIPTIGYGHIAPTRAAGKVTCMFYATVGVPLTGILLARTSDVFGEKVYAIYKSKLSGQKQRSRVFIVTATVLYLLLGFVVFLFLPAIVFVFIEGWSYLDSIYYAFITLTTIGFGDLVSGQNMDPGTGHTFYQLFVIVWIISSLGYWVMVANFITRALRSKKLHASLLHRAKLLKEIMDKQSDPVFLPQRSKYTMNFMMQLSSMLAVDPEAAQELQLSDADEAPSLRETKARSASMPMGIPGIASLFNLPQSSPSSINTQICKSLVNSVPDGGFGGNSRGGRHSTNPTAPPSPSPTTHSLNTTVSTLTIDCD
ncbi:Potassium channel domain [Trinorchestia longiramus]|nr:Potassium channel domain [Trinorchestia longiramus]